MSSAKIIKNVSTKAPSLGGNITKRHIVEAREEARRIVSEAEAAAAGIRESAQTLACESREAAYREGYETALQEWNTLLFEARERRDQALAEVEQDVLRLAVKIAEKILGRELKRAKATVVDIVANALRQARRNEMVTVRVNPADLPVIESHSERFALAERRQLLDFVADPRVGEGGCVIESESGAIDAQLATQLRVLERALLTRTTTEER